jgi:hypothetical protein
MAADYFESIEQHRAPLMTGAADPGEHTLTLADLTKTKPPASVSRQPAGDFSALVVLVDGAGL